MITNFYKNVNEFFSVAHFALQNTKFGSEKGKVQKPARIPPQTPPAGGKKAERGEKRILGASQGRSATARDGVARFFSRKILVTFHSPRKIVCPAESKLVFRILLKKSSNINQKTPQQNNEPSMNILGDLFYRRRGIRTEPRRSPR